METGCDPARNLIRPCPGICAERIARMSRDGMVAGSGTAAAVDRAGATTLLRRASDNRRDQPHRRVDDGNDQPGAVGRAECAVAVGGNVPGFELKSYFD